MCIVDSEAIATTRGCLPPLYNLVTPGERTGPEAPCHGTQEAGMAKAGLSRYKI